MRISWLRRFTYVAVAVTILIVVVVRKIDINASGKDVLRKRDSFTFFFSSEIDCSRKSRCSADQLTIFLSTGTLDKPPSLCINGKRIFDKTKLVTGLNIAVYDCKEKKVTGIHYLNLSNGDRAAIETLALIQSNEVLIAASHGNIVPELTQESLQLLDLFGFPSSLFKNNTSFFLVGQLGLTSDKAYQKVAPLNESKAENVFKCVDVPMMKVSNATAYVPLIRHGDPGFKHLISIEKGRKMNVNYGAAVVHCGREDPCPKGHIAMSFYSGKNKDDVPRMCVKDHLIFDRDLNSAGRGLNLAVIDSKTQQVVRTGHFDTYGEDSTLLVLFLEQLTQGEIVAVVSFDEASTRLSDLAKQIFYELGSSLIRNMKFRASWYFIGQKGIDGYTPFEDMTLPSGSDWAKAINTAVCVPFILDGVKTGQQKKVQNMPRRHFCIRYDGYGNFCNEAVLDLPITPRSTQKVLSHTNPVYSTPVLLVTGLTKNNVRLCLESMFEQEGIQPQNIVVTYDSAYNEIGELSMLFDTQPVPVNNTQNYNDLLVQSVDWIFMSYPSAASVIVVKEDVALLPGFFYYIGQLMPQFLKDETANAISAYYGIANDATDPHIVYRIENSATGAAFVLKKAAFENFVKNDETNCCNGTERDWIIPGVTYAPDVTRVKLVKHSKIALSPEDEKTSLKPITRTELNGNESISNVDRLGEKEYDAELRGLLRQSTRFFFESSSNCSRDALNSAISGGKRMISVVFPAGSNVLTDIFNCISLKLDDSYGFYKGVMRFTNGGISYMIVQRDSPLLHEESKNVTAVGQ